MQELVYYNAARNALAQAASVDEVKDIRDKAEAIRLYAQQQQDSELERFAAQIKTRAMRRLGELSRELDRAKIIKRGVSEVPISGKFKNDVLADAGISKSTAYRCEKLAAIPEKKFEKAISDGATSTQILRTIKREENEALPRVEAPLGKYDVIVIDPPWPMEKIEREAFPNQHEFDYPTMSIEDIKEIDLPSADDCHLFCWTTQKFLPATLDIIKDWEFRYVLTMVWHKNGGFQPFGLPQYNCEFAVYARRGTPKFIETKAFPTCFSADRLEHSVKPSEFYSMIERVTDGKRIDMFSRQQRNGFEGWGNEHGKL